MDEKVYTNAVEFNPDRFMVKDPPMDPRLFTFGMGRRFVSPHGSYVMANRFVSLNSC